MIWQVKSALQLLQSKEQDSILRGFAVVINYLCMNCRHTTVLARKSLGRYHRYWKGCKLQCTSDFTRTPVTVSKVYVVLQVPKVEGFPRDPP